MKKKEFEIGKTYKILLVDDEAGNNRNLFDVLHSDIYNLLVASNGQQAVELTLKHNPDAIIMDWDMPEMDGLSATKIIRETPEINHTPIILSTGKMTSVENLQTALEAGANDYIRKPFDAIEIKARIESMIRLRKEQQRILELEREILQQKLHESERELEKNQQALAASKIRLLHNNKYIDRILSDLSAISQNTTEDTRKNMQNLISELTVDIRKDNWQEFENHFEKIHPSFLINIRKQCPDLSTSELELCMLFKLNMTTTEIASITHKTDETLKKARHRLKKKFGLTQEQSLINFILEIN